MNASNAKLYAHLTSPKAPATKAEKKAAPKRRGERAGTQHQLSDGTIYTRSATGALKRDSRIRMSKKQRVKTQRLIRAAQAAQAARK